MIILLYKGDMFHILNRHKICTKMLFSHTCFAIDIMIQVI